MTVLLAFTSRPHKTSFLGADDVEIFSGARCEKVLQWNGFLFGGLGNDVIIDAARFVGAFGPEPTLLRDYTSYAVPSTIEEFCATVEGLLPLIVPRREQTFLSAVERGSRTPAQQRELAAQHGNLIIIDTRKRRLVRADFGPLFPARAVYTVSITEFSSERVYRFGINDPLDLGPITPTAREHPFRWCQELVTQAGDEVEQHLGRRLIGELGACWLERNGKFRFRSAFSSLTEFTQSFYPPLPSGSA